MSETTRREFLKDAGLVGAALATASELLPAALAQRPAGVGAAAAASPVAISWLGDQAPLVPAGVSWGVPWSRGALARNRPVTVRSAAGQAIPTQSWPLAFWPDGTIKWTGLAIAAEAQLAGPFTVAAAPTTAPATPVRVQDSTQSVEISTGPLTCRIARAGENLIDSLAIDGREVARAGRLIVVREDRSAYGNSRTLREEDFTGRIGKVTVEQSGPIRAVVHIEGTHAADATGSQSARQWLPFSVRLYFTAGLNSVRMVHSFVFDGDQATDFIRGLGVAFTIPFREETQNRYIRFATDSDGIFAEPVVMAGSGRAGFAGGGRGARGAGGAGAIAATGALPAPVVPAVVPAAPTESPQVTQLLGKRIPNLADMQAGDQTSLKAVAVWDTFKLTQLAPDSFELSKRTNPSSSWLHISNGQRARGLVFIGDVSGGLAVGVKRFWQKYPAALEIANASTPAGELKIWFWSPDAPAMDLRHYDTVGHSLGVTYEDYQTGFSTPTGVANTSELTLWATPDVPEAAALVAMAKSANEPPLLICTPQHYYDTHTLGVWSLPHTAVPGLAAADIASAEAQLDRAFTFYQGEVDRRRWYGFWDYGDVIRTYDPVRHQWMYDFGGHGWNNTELMPNAWLWFAFLRSGRADIFRFAEAMTRNTNEVDIYHLGRFAGLGSRHNVNHWGDGAKEARINEAFVKRFYFYLTTDERTGDLLREPLAVVEQTLVNVPPLREVLPRTDVKPVIIRIGPDWIALASNWLAEWERTGDTRYRDYLLTGMKDIGAMPEDFTTVGGFRYDPATKHLSAIGQPNQAVPDFMILFGGDQIAMDLMSLIDCPEFNKAWFQLMEKWGKATGGSSYTKVRSTGYAAMVSRDPALQAATLNLFRGLLKFNGNDYFLATPNVITGSAVPETVFENPSRSSFKPGLATPEVSQWAINLITAPELMRQFQPPSA